MDHRDPILCPTYEPPGCGLAVLVLIGSAVILLLAALIARAAPVPVARPIPPVAVADLVGEWELLWGGTPWKIRLTKEGGYSSSAPAVWYGSWAYKDGTLYVDETSADGSSHLVWSVALKQERRRGKLAGASGGKVTFHGDSGKTPGPDASLRRK